jgi:hypothetical protein
MASSQPQPIAPLPLSTVKARLPRLFRQYTFLSDREKDFNDDMGEEKSPIDVDTGCCTTIMSTDFTETLVDRDHTGQAMKSASDANKFSMFLWKMLNASESGSIGGDACRQYDILSNALVDTKAMRPVAEKFEHLLGWTGAVANHGIDALLQRGDPTRNKPLFKSAADEWKKVFEKTDGNAVVGVSDAQRTFAIQMCESFQRMLKDAKKEYELDTNYTFNFIKKVKKSVAAVPTVVPATATAAAPAPAFTDGEGIQNKVTIVVTKSSKDAKLGFSLTMENGTLKVTSILPEFVGAGSKLEVGMTIDTINGEKFNTLAGAVCFVKEAEGQLTVVAAHPAVSKPAAAAPAAKPAHTNQKENSVPTKNSVSIEDDELKPWEMDGWVPMRGDTQKTPNTVRNELQKYIDQCKADRTMTQTRIIEKMGVNNNTFRRFMDPKTYKNQWSAAQNGTYWGAAKLLAEVKYEKDKAKKSGTKRKAGSDDSSEKKAKAGNFLSNNTVASSAKNTKADALELINRIHAVEGVPDKIVYDSCPQVVAKIKTFLQRDEMTKATLMEALSRCSDKNIQGTQLNRFLAGKKQDQCGSVVYNSAYIFFEKFRILEGQNKTKARLKNEAEQRRGFSLRKSRGGGWMISVRT